MVVKTVILSGARTPFGKFGGSLSKHTAAQLGAIAIKAALQRAEVEPVDVQGVIIGTVLQGGQGQLPSRQAARAAGVPWEVCTETVNKVCASGMRAVTLADQMIRAGDEEVIVAGGMESMSNAPYILPNARWGHKMGDTAMLDLLVHDGLTCSFSGVHMGVYGNLAAQAYGVSREEQDQYAVSSHKRALTAMETGRLAEEIVAVEIQHGKTDKWLMTADEAPRKNTTLEVLAKLPSVFGQVGTITAGNAPGINDGAAALVMMSDARARKTGKVPLAYILGHAEIAVVAQDFPQTPGLAINKLLKRTGKTLAEIDLFEINEAFAAVALISGKIANLDFDKVNVNGGAVALGHPIGASGTRIILTLAYELRRRGGGLGIAAICSGGGQGDAVLIEVPKI